MSSEDAAPRAAVPASNARAEASRRNGAKSRGPKTPEGKARSSRNALKHGMRAQKFLVLPEEDAAEFETLAAALIEELAPEGPLQTALARRVAVAAWRLERADRMEVEVFEERRFADGGLGLSLIRDGNGTRSFETLLRYRGAAMAEFWRALRTLKALQAEQAAPPPARALDAEPATVLMFEPRRTRAAGGKLGLDQLPPREEPCATPIEPDADPARATSMQRVHGPSEAGRACSQPDEPEPRGRRPGPDRKLPEPGASSDSDQPGSGRSLHEPAVPWRPNEPDAEA